MSIRLSAVLFALMLALSACQNKHRIKPLRIASAASLQYVLKDLTETFTEQSNIPCELIFSSSGKLTAQIKSGAPYDVFLSADRKYTEELAASDFALSPPKVFAHGKLVLWSLDGALKGLDDLKKSNYEHIALANERTAPYGMAAKEVLVHSKILPDVASKLVFGESIAQVNQFVHSGAADVGFTAKSVVLSKQLSGVGSWVEIDAKWYSPIEHSIVVLKSKREDEGDAEKFSNFLFSKLAQIILDGYGLTPADVNVGF